MAKSRLDEENSYDGTDARDEAIRLLDEEVRNLRAKLAEADFMIEDLHTRWRRKVKKA